MQIKKAVRSQVKIKIAITGPTGSGKSYSALRLAFGLGKKILGIDSENGSLSLYAKFFPEFDVIDLTPPYTVEKYLQALSLGVKGGYDVILIDSITHAWAGEGGLLQIKEQLDSRPKSNSYTNWSKLTPIQEKFIAGLLHSPVHLIATMRSKMSYELVDENGKKKPVKAGLAPIQRDGIEYEFTTVFDVAMNHEAQVSKDRTGLFADKFFTITEDTGKIINDWLDSAEKTEVINIELNKSLVNKLIGMKDDERTAKLKVLADALGRQTLTGNEIIKLNEVDAKKLLSVFDGAK